MYRCSGLIKYIKYNVRMLVSVKLGGVQGWEEGIVGTVDLSKFQPFFISMRSRVYSHAFGPEEPKYVNYIGLR